MEEKKQQSDIQIDSVQTKETRPSQESIVISQKGKNTRNIPAVLFIVKLPQTIIRKKWKNPTKNSETESTKK